MGWTCTNKPQNIKSFLAELGNFSNGENHQSKTLDIKIKNFNTAYMAIEQINHGIRTVVAGVILLQYYPKDNTGENFCYKDMCESMGPNRADCPESILKLLTATDNQNAINWRKKCWDNIAKCKARPKMTKGIKLFSKEGITYNSRKCHKFLVETKSRAWSVDGGFMCKFPRRLLDHCITVNSFDDDIPQTN